MERVTGALLSLRGHYTGEPGFGYPEPMSPTIFRVSGYRFFFFSREEPRAHVHVQHAAGQAKFWLEPEVALAQNYGLSDRQLATALRLVRKHKDEIRAAWQSHFGRRGQ